MSNYTMPNVDIGDSVLWYLDGDDCEEPAAAIVTRVGHRRVSLTIFQEGHQTGTVRSGVPNLADPDLQKMSERMAGAWEFANDRERRLADAAREAKKAKSQGAATAAT